MTTQFPEPMGSLAFQAGQAAGRAVQPGQVITVPPEYVANGTNGEYVDGLQQGMNEAAAAQQAAAVAPVAAPVTFTMPAATPSIPAAEVAANLALLQQQAAAQAAATLAAERAAQAAAAPTAGSLLDQMAGMLDVTPAVAATPAVTSPGGFSLLDGIEDDLDKGSGTPFMFTNPGDQIVGYVRYVDEIRTDYTDPKTGLFKMALLLDIEDAEGNMWTVRGYGAGLDGQLRKENPQVGDGIAIRFTGMQQGKAAGSVPYKVFNARVRRAQ